MATNKGHDDKLLHRILELEDRVLRLAERTFEEMERNHRLLREILHLLKPRPIITGFTEIQESTMVPLAAGQTATFATTPIPATSVPVPANLVWSSSDPVNAPVSPNAADPTGLSTLVAFPSNVAAGVSFSLTLSYTNSDGTPASQTNSFVTVAPPSPDITGFAPIAQTA
jgi:hypothetical protein